MASLHPTPGEAEVVAFGGSIENLFKRMEILIKNVAATTIFHFGESLYLSC